MAQVFTKRKAYDKLCIRNPKYEVTTIMRLREVARKAGFHEALKAARLKRGWTKYRLAKALGVSWLTVNAWEKGRSAPSVLNTLKLVRIFPELLELVNGGDGDGEERKER
jgi:DNA-binding XRE family transcriptional regulator